MSLTVICWSFSRLCYYSWACT